ncbi:MAG: alpha/beta hydrolase [Acidimicrobiales bacterium]
MTEEGSSGHPHRLAGALALGVGAVAAVGSVLQHRSVTRAATTEQDIESEGLRLPGDLLHHFVEAEDGGRIHVVEGGTGPVVMLLHGFLLDSSIWAHQFRDLAHRHRVIAIDHRGHGKSLPGVGALGVRRLAADLAAVLEELDLSKVLLVGHSMGGMVALQLVEDSRETIRRRVTGMVLASTLAGPFFQMPGWVGLARVAAPASARAALFASRLGVPSVLSQDLRYWVSRFGFGSDARPAQVRFVEALHTATSSRTLAGLLPSLALFDLFASLGSIEEPVLVVVGSHDRLTPPRAARRMVGALPHAQLAELARCGHMPMIERPHEFSRLLDEFSAKIERRS